MRSLLRLADWADDTGKRSHARRDAASVALFSLLLLPWALPLASVGPWLGAGATVSTVVASVLLFALAVFVSPLRGEPFLERPALITGALLTLALFAGAGFYLYSPLASGFPTCTGGDAGQHVTLMVQHCRGAGADYRTLGFHATAYLVQQAFATSTLLSFSAVFHVVVFGLAGFAALATVVFAEQQGARRSRELATIAVATGVVLWLVGRSILLPVLHRFQCDGYLPQIFGLLALLFACSSYALAERRLLRWGGLMLSLVFLRLSYVLNAGDILLTFAVLAVVEARSSSGRVRGVLYLGAVASAGLGVLAYVSIYPVSFLNGGFARYEALPAFGSVALFSSLLIAVFVLSGGSSKNTRGERLQIISGIFCLLGVVVPILWILLSESAEHYYFYKYPFAATLIAPCVLLPWLVVSLCMWRKSKMPALRRNAMLVLAGLVLVGVGLGHDAYGGGYRRTLLRRSDAGLTGSLVGLHADARIVKHIRGILESEQAMFGGFYTHRWPEESFTNAILGRSYFEIDETRPEPEPGHCVFWDTDFEQPHWANEPKTRAVARLEASGNQTCATLDGRTEQTTPNICHRCNPA